MIELIDSIGRTKSSSHHALLQRWYFTEPYINAPFQAIQLTTTEEVLSDLELKIIMILMCENLLSFIWVNMSNNFQMFYSIVTICKLLHSLKEILSSFEFMEQCLNHESCSYQAYYINCLRLFIHSFLSFNLCSDKMFFLTEAYWWHAIL